MILWQIKEIMAELFGEAKPSLREYGYGPVTAVLVTYVKDDGTLTLRGHQIFVELFSRVGISSAGKQ